MASIEGIVKATSILAEKNPNNVLGGLGSEKRESGDIAIGLKSGEDGSVADAVVITKRVVVVETETVVESTLDSYNYDLVDTFKDENGVLCSVLDKNDDVVCGDEEIKKNSEDVCADFPANVDDVIRGGEKIIKDSEDVSADFLVNVDVVGGDGKITKYGEVSCTESVESGKIGENGRVDFLDGMNDVIGGDGKIEKDGDISCTNTGEWGKIGEDGCVDFPVNMKDVIGSDGITKKDVGDGCAYFPVNMNDGIGGDVKVEKDGEDGCAYFPVNINDAIQDGGKITEGCEVFCTDKGESGEIGENGCSPFVVNMIDVIGGDGKIKKDGEDGCAYFPVNMNDVIGGDGKVTKNSEFSCTNSGESGKIGEDGYAGFPVSVIDVTVGDGKFKEDGEDDCAYSPVNMNDVRGDGKVTKNSEFSCTDNGGSGKIGEDGCADFPVNMNDVAGGDGKFKKDFCIVNGESGKIGEDGCVVFSVNMNDVVGSAGIIKNDVEDGCAYFPVNMNDGISGDRKIKKAGDYGCAYSPVNISDFIGDSGKFSEDGEIFCTDNVESGKLSEDGSTAFLVKTNDVIGSDGKTKKYSEVSFTHNGECGRILSEANVDANRKEQGNIDGEKVEDFNNVYHVGDFVWGKIKSHPWWPGQIYDSKDASEFALQHSQEGRLLVAYFGDGSCSWSLPSQLVPFVDNFKLMSADGSSKSFLNAIESAVTDIGRLVEDTITCKCIPLDKREGLARPLVSNSGIKKRVLVPDVDIRRLSVPDYQPSQILEKLMNYAKDVPVECLLELALLRSWISAFYRAKGGGYRLPVYREPVYIEGLEDKNETVSAATDDFSVPIDVPILGPWEEGCFSSPAVKFQASSDDKIYHRRKQKSVAELMREDNGRVKLRSQKRGRVGEEERESVKSSSAQKRRKIDTGELVGCSKGKTVRKRERGVSESPEITTEKVSGAEETGDGMKEGYLSGKRKEIEIAVGESTFSEAKEGLETINTPRGRKKSKYLSPPYTDIIWRTGNLGSKMKSKPEESESDRASDEELPIVQLKSPDTTAQTVENVKKLTFSASDIATEVNELLSEVKFAAVNILYLSKKGSLDTVWAFVSALRSATYLHGPDYKIYEKSKSDRKKWKSLKNKTNDVAQEKAVSADDTKTPKGIKKAEGKKPDKSKSRKSSEFSHGAKKDAEKLERNVSTCLILTFTPGFPLPLREEIMRLYGKFGSLNEKETNVLTESHSVRIVYLKESDAEAAFESSVTESPFGIENVNYWLQHSSAGLKSRPEISSRDSDELQSADDDFMSDVRAVRQKLDITTVIWENHHSKFSTEEKSSLKDEMKNLMENVETVSEKVRILAEKTTS
ncbi:hypothetical protein OROGR_007637 [Orobanche gracilis]